MSEVGVIAGTGQKSSNLTWILTLFGTAVGAGILFLPISAGRFGFWPLVILTILIGLIVYFSHRTYSRIMTYSGIEGTDILEIVRMLLGKRWGLWVGLMYFCALYPILLVYGVSITNTLDSFFVNQLGLLPFNRALIAILAVATMTFSFGLGQGLALRISSILVYPLIAVLAGVFLYLIPYWDIDSFLDFSSPYSVGVSLLLILPVLMFALCHMGSISQLVVDLQRSGSEKLDSRVSRVKFWAVALLVVFTMFFVWSCSLALGAEGMTQALHDNIPVLSYFANVTETPFLAYLAPLVAICAIVTSYLGVMLGAEEGATYVISRAAPHLKERISERTLSLWIYAFFFVTASLAAILNPSILDLISAAGGILL